MSFPPEIIERFILHVSSDKTDTPRQRRANLSTYCRVSRTWCGLAQRLLFAEISTANGATGDTVEITALLARTLIDSPHTLSYVKTLFLRISISYPRNPLIKIIENLTNLDGLRIIHLKYEETPLHAGLLKVLPSALSSTRLTSLGLSDLTRVPLSILGYSLALEELVIKHSTFVIPDPLEEAITNPATKRPSPKVFILSTSSSGEVDILEGILREDGPLDISRITKFWAIDRSDGDGAHSLICKFTSAIASSLEDVLIDPPTSCFQSVELTEQFPSEKLSSLRIAQFSVLQCNSDEYNAVPWVTSAIARLCNPEKLETIKLHCEFRDLDSRTDEGLLKQGWAQFDSKLVPRRFSNLRKLDITCYNEQSEAEGVTLLMNLTALLDGASEEILMIDCSNDYSYVDLVGPEWIR
ncbi:hypothetical protein BDN72DRAFT_877634 [Pluteus cervinus]|uniref:Uncharacterized protein n=1 Tax=Pluteus cervinus TaxID=181527 RepID=A0ACD3AZD7_9AGAR|nr:hypothetical protein BDN72DRAFT_877634 [Pluteus cervinus]